MSRRTIFRAAALTALAFCLSGVAASAAGAVSVYVSNTVPVVPGGHSCGQPGFSTVQAGIEGAHGGTVNVCAGTYVEQIAIASKLKLTGVGGATLAMPESPSRSESPCDTKANVEEGPLDQADEISICTTGTVTMSGLTVQAVVPLETCENGLNAIFIGGGATLKATNLDVDGASTSLPAYKGCQHGIAVRVGSASREEVGHAVLKSDTISGYEKNGPTVAGAGSTMSITNSTVTGEGPSPYIAQNGIQISFGGKGTVKGTTISGNECNAPSCGAEGEQAAGVLFYEAAAGSSISGSAIKENDMGAYYASGSETVPAAPDVTIGKSLLRANRFEGIALEEGRAAVKSDTIEGPGRVGIALYQFEESLSSSESSATKTRVSGQSEAAIKVESDLQPGDKPGRFEFIKSTHSEDGTVVIDESPSFEVIF